MLSKAYGSHHLEQIQEFRDHYILDGQVGEWSDASALTFIKTKFARPQSDFDHKTKGVKHKFYTQAEMDNVRKRTVGIYDMCDTVAALHLERNEVTVRRAKGTSAAAKERTRAATST